MEASPDGVQFSGTLIGQLNIRAGQELRFRISCPETAVHIAEASACSVSGSAITPMTVTTTV